MEHNGDEKIDSKLSKNVRDVDHLDLESLLQLPEFAEENNPNLPFDCSRAVRIGWIEDYFHVAGIRGIDWDSLTRKMVIRAANLGYGKRPLCFSRNLNLALPLARNGDKISLDIDTTSSNPILRFGDNTQLCERTFLEVWEGKNLICKTSVSNKRTRRLTEIRPGVSLFLRVGEESVGTEVLLTETEFSAREWKSVLMYLVLAGNLIEAAHVATEKLLPCSDQTSGMRKFLGFLKSASEYTKATPDGLIPLPAFRGGPGTDQSVEVEGLSLIKDGIETCWPNIRNQGVGVSEDLAELINASETGIVSEERLLEFESGKPVGPSEDPAIQNGWLATIGWMKIRMKKFDEASKAFGASQPTDNDPFGMQIGRSLADHLSQVSNTSTPKPNVVSNDAIWSKALPLILD